MRKQKSNVLILRDLTEAIGGSTVLYVVDCTSESDDGRVLVDGVEYKDVLSKDTLMPYLEFEVFHLGIREGTTQMEILIQEQKPS